MFLHQPLHRVNSALSLSHNQAVRALGAVSALTVALFASAAPGQVTADSERAISTQSSGRRSDHAASFNAANHPTQPAQAKAGGGIMAAGSDCAWSALGTGMNSSVWALTVFDDGGGPALYTGGEFTTAGGVSANRIVKLDGTSWSALGTGMNRTVIALTVFDDGGGPALYAGGFFTFAGGQSANRIAKWSCPTCAPPDCHGNGTCVDTTCDCDAGYAGTACDQCAPDYYNYPNCVFCEASTTCSGHGACNALGDCECDTGYAGDACNQCATDYYDYPNCVFCEASTICSGNGTCNALGDCDCDAGFAGTACDQCAVDIREYPNCVIDVIPTVSEWGLLVLTLVIATVAKIVFGSSGFLRRRRASTP